MVVQKKALNHGQHANAFGWDPTGAKTLKQAFNPENQKTTFQPDLNKRKRTMRSEAQHVLNYYRKQKGQKIITETMNSSSEDKDSGSMLDENNLL